MAGEGMFADGLSQYAERGSLTVELHYGDPAAIDAQALLAAVQEELPATTLEGIDPIMLAHGGYETTLDGEARPVCSVVFAPSAEYVADQSRIDLSQSWSVPDPEGLLAQSEGQLCVVEIFGRLLTPAERLRVFRETVMSVCELTGPVAAWWPTSTQITGAPEPDEPLMGLLNVRLFRAGDTGGLLMDTLGLSAFGLPDLQCVARGIDASELAGFLYNAGAYVLENGDIIEDGNTLEGLFPGQRWNCQHKLAAAGPDRVVIDVDPGPEYAAVDPS